MATNRGYVYQSGDKDRIIDYLERCEKRMLKQFAEIRAKAKVTRDESEHGLERKEIEFALDDIIALCGVYVDKRSDKQRMQGEIDDLKEQVRRLTEDIVCETTLFDSEKEGDSECDCC